MTTTTSAPAAWTVRRTGIAAPVSAAGAAVLTLGLFAVPFGFQTSIVQDLTTLLTFVILAAMWNALAGYGGMVSVGQQAFIGFGAYATVFFTQHGLPPYLSVVVAAILSPVLAVILAPLLLRLRGGQFAIGTWVVATVLALLATFDSALGGGTGVSLGGLNDYAPDLRNAYTYWLTLSFTLLLLVMLFLILRYRTGTALQAIRDDEEAAASLGVRTSSLKFGLFVLAGFGCGAAGALTMASTLFIQPQSIFGVQWSAYMIFMVLVGGLGTFEGPIIGAVLYFFLQNQFNQQGAWYLIGLGAIAIAFALFLPGGLWSLLTRRFTVHLLPVGYKLSRQPAQQAGRPESP